jgi:IPT/TIG domain-containing protein/fibronectin type III domain protein/thrombospondin type 3 repeat protein
MLPAISLRPLCRVAFATVFIVLAYASHAGAQSVTLAWNPNPESDLAGYRVQYGTVSGNPSTTVDVGNVTTRQFTGLQFGVTYYFRVVAYNTSSMVSTPSAEVSFTPVAPSVPTLTSISPTSGPTGGGTVITLSGTNFASGATVTVGGAAATSVQVISATQVRATTPAGSAGARTVQITVGGQAASLSGAFTYTAPAPAPTLTSISPTSGPTAGGTVITLTGTNFASGATVTVGGTAATSVQFVSATQVRATSPAGTAGARTVQITVNGQSASLSNAFTYTAAAPAPTVTSVSPSSGPTAGGTAVTLAGTNFVSGATVRIGGTAATGVTFVSATQLRATTPAGSAGGQSVQVTNPDGQSATRASAFTYTAPTPGPSLTSVSPASGPAAGGTAVTLTGTNFVAGTTVTIGGNVATNVVVASATRITAVTPAGTAGARDVRVAASAGSSTLAGGFTYAAGSSTDSDNDGLPNDWETQFGLDPNSASGANGASGDPDGDGVTNANERAAGSHPRGTLKRYLAEGVSNGFFDTRFAIANANTTAARVLLTFLDSTGATTRHFVSVPARSRATVEATDVAALEGASFATTLESDQVVVLDRLMSWTGKTGYAAHMETAVEQPSTTWYLAEGATHGSFELFYLVMNPSTSPANLQVRYLRPEGRPPVVKTYTVGAGSRFTIWVDQEDPALAATDVSAQITSTNGVPVIVERSMYLNTTTAFKGGHNSAGVTAPSTSWFLAEGSTGSYFSMYVLFANPNAQAASLRVTYLRGSGAPVVKNYSVAANSRRTVSVAQEDSALADAAVSVKVESTNGVPVIVERTMWWPGSNRRWTEGHNAFGTTRTAPRWLLAEGELGGPDAVNTFVLVANTSAAAANVRVTMLREGAAEQSATYTIAANRRFTVPIASAFPGADGQRFAILVESLNPSTAGALVVERAMYWNTDGEVWSAGSAAVGAIIP